METGFIHQGRHSFSPTWTPQGRHFPGGHGTVAGENWHHRGRGDHTMNQAHRLRHMAMHGGHDVGRRQATHHKNRASHTQHPAGTNPIGARTPGLLSNVGLVGNIAHQKGVDPVTAVASMLVESHGNSHSQGDHGTSFGLFQLHRGGELGRLSPQQAFNPATNANVALSEFARHRGLHGGALAGAAQRPRNPEAYAAKVNASMGYARQLLREAGVQV